MGKNVSLYFDDEVIDAIKKIAAEENRSVSHLINEILKQAIKSQEEVYENGNE